VAIAAGASGIPFILDDLPEAVHHASVTLLTGGLASLELSIHLSIGLDIRTAQRLHAGLHNVQRVPEGSQLGRRDAAIETVHDQNLCAIPILARSCSIRRSD
jgi:hypothetical protein